MTHPQLDNLMRIGKLKAEPPAEAELSGLLRSGSRRLADALRGSMVAAEYKHVVLGLIFLKYISDAFEAQTVLEQAELLSQGWVTA